MKNIFMKVSKLTKIRIVCQIYCHPLRHYCRNHYRRSFPPHFSLRLYNLFLGTVHKQSYMVSPDVDIDIAFRKDFLWLCCNCI